MNPKEKLRNETINFLNNFGEDDKIKTKFKNICGKTGQYNVPDELFQKRTSRKNRVLITWKTVKKNKLTLEQLETFYGGVVVEFINEDYFEEVKDDKLFNELKNRLGSDKIVSAMISIRNEDGSSSSGDARKAFIKLKEKFPKWNNLLIKRKPGISNDVNIGNEKWEGYIYVHIAGGQQDVIKSHTSSELLFNPACEYANEEICLDIDLVMSFFALNSIDKDKLNKNQQRKLSELLNKLKNELVKSSYDGGNLLDYCKNHPCLILEKNKLFDPIQVEQINISDFSIDNKEDDRNLDLTHNESVNKARFYFDHTKNCILTPARPNNLFWSKHLSNMMQQNFSLEEYFKHEEDIVKKRNAKLKESEKLI
ncbi:MAG: hypothetical protein KGH55_01545 [Nanoarchaeota archaeon]|nr:hypothetical protein [Nanoarchaeota archaeon]